MKSQIIAVKQLTTAQHWTASVPGTPRSSSSISSPPTCRGRKPSSRRGERVSSRQPGWQFNRKKFDLCPGLKNSLRIQFDSATLISDLFLIVGNGNPKLKWFLNSSQNISHWIASQVQPRLDVVVVNGFLGLEPLRRDGQGLDDGILLAASLIQSVTNSGSKLTS